MRGICNYIHHMILKCDIIRSPNLFTVGEILKKLIEMPDNVNLAEHKFYQKLVFITACASSYYDLFVL